MLRIIVRFFLAATCFAPSAQALDVAVRLAADLNTDPNLYYNGFTGAINGGSLAGHAGREFVEHRGRLYMVAETPQTGYAIFSTDGSQDIAQLEFDPDPGPRSSEIGGIFSGISTLYFQRKVDETWYLWALDEAGARSVAELENASSATVVADRVLFSFHGQLWAVDGMGNRVLIEQAGTPAVAMWHPSSFVPAENGAVYARSQPTQNGTTWQVVSTDGTLEGTHVLWDGLTEPECGIDAQATSNQGQAWVAITNCVDRLLLTTDGSTTGTRLVKHWQTTPGAYGFLTMGPSSSYHGRVYFSESLIAGTQRVTRLWQSEGTEESTTVVTEIPLDVNAQDPFRQVVAVDGGAVFVSSHLPYPQSAWVWRITDQNLSPVVINGENLSAGHGLTRHPTGFATRLDGRILVNNDNSGFYLVAATEGGNVFVSSPVDLQLTRSYEWNGRIVFPAGWEASPVDLWSTNGTTDGTVPLVDVWHGTESMGLIPVHDRPLPAIGSRLFMTGRRPSPPPGHAQGPLEIVSLDLESRQAAFHQLPPGIDVEVMVAVDDHLVHLGASGAEPNIRFVSADFSVSGTISTSNITNSLVPVSVTGSSFVVFACRPNNPHEHHVCKWSPNSGLSVLTPALAMNISAFRHVGTAGAIALFNIGNTVWRTDGSPSGTFQVAAVQVPTTSFETRAISAAIGQRLVFCGDDGWNAYGLWISDGSLNGTTQLAPMSGSCRGFVSNGREAFFIVSSYAGSVPQKTLWRTDGTETGSYPIISGSSAWLPEIVGNKVHLPSFEGADYVITDGTITGTRVLSPPDGWFVSGIHSTSSVSANGETSAAAVATCLPPSGHGLCMISEDGDKLASTSVWPGGSDPVDTPILLLGGGEQPLLAMADDGRHGVEPHVILTGGIFRSGFEKVPNRSESHAIASSQR